MSLENFEIVIVSSPRCGSHLLASMVSEGGVECETEILNPYANQFDPKLRVVGTEEGWRMLAVAATRAGYRGFIVQRAAAHGSPSFWRALESYPGPVCFLHRRNMLASIVSRLLARKKMNPWWTRQPRPSVGTLKLGRNEVAGMVRDYREESLARIRDLSGSEVYPFVFEDLALDYAGSLMFRRLATRLRLEPGKAKPRTFRQESRELSKVVTNWDEVAVWSQEGLFDVSEVEEAMRVWK